MTERHNTNESLNITKHSENKDLSFYFRNQNLRADQSNVLKFQRYPTEYDKQNPLLA